MSLTEITKAPVLGNSTPAKVLMPALIVMAGLLGSNVCAQSSDPVPDEDAIHEHVIKALAAAGDDQEADFYHRCFIDPLYSDTIAHYRKTAVPIEPFKVFDNLYLLSENDNNVWVLKTSEGLVVFDSFNNPAEAAEYIEGGLKKLGLDPTQIKYVVLTHGHGDHFGGSKYLQETFGAHIMTSKPDWNYMENEKRPRRAYVPRHDMEIEDGQQFKFGDTTVTFYITPGHSPGSVSAIFNVTDYGEPHVVGYFGGMGSPSTEANRNLIIRSYSRWQGIAAAAGVDVLIGNHQVQDNAIEKVEYMRVRRKGDLNPFVLGEDKYQRYIEIQKECTKVALARHGQKIEE